jgi:hypothetical protein
LFVCLFVFGGNKENLRKGKIPCKKVEK